MRKKVLIITAVGLALLVAVIAVAVNAVFTVSDIVVNFYPVSETGEEESYALQQLLDERFLGKSSAFLNLDEVKDTVLEYPAFELVEIRKDYPSTVVLTVAERREMYCILKENGTAHFGFCGR